AEMSAGPQRVRVGSRWVGRRERLYAQVIGDGICAILLRVSIADIGLLFFILGVPRFSVRSIRHGDQLLSLSIVAVCNYHVYGKAFVPRVDGSVGLWSRWRCAELKNALPRAVRLGSHLRSITCLRPVHLLRKINSISSSS